jgi:SAM-dependent methyltransferase
VQRYRDEQVSLLGELAVRIGHLATHHAGGIKPVCAFQDVNECSGNVVKANRRARPMVDRRVGDGRHGAMASMDRVPEPGSRALPATGSGRGVCGRRLAANGFGMSPPVREWRAMAPDPVIPNPVIVDRNLLRARRRRALALGPSTFLADRVADDLADRLATVLRTFPCAVALGTPIDGLQSRLAGGGKVGALIATDALVETVAGRAGLAIAADEEALPFRDGSLDLVVSALALHFVNDLPGTLVQIRRALRPDGLFVAALLGGDTLTELRQAFAAAEAEMDDGISPRVLPFADLRDLGGLLQRAGFALPVTDIERLTVRYASPLALMQDLRRMGATNPLVDRRRRPLRRATLRRMLEIYAARFADPDQRIRATFEIVFLSGWAPHASQQQPLRPGSARARLADALGTQERSAGEKAGR